MKKNITIFLLLIMTLTFVGPATIWAQGKLDDFEKEIEDSNDKDDDDKESDEDDSHGIVGDVMGDLMGRFFWEITKASMRVVFYGLPADYDARYKLKNFSNYPYAANGSYYSPINDKTHSLHIRTSGFAALDNITGVEERISYSVVPAVSLTGQLSILTESLSRSKDVMNLGSVFIKYNRIRTRRMRYGYGLGVKFLERKKAYSGPAMNFEIDWFIRKPFSAYYYWDFGLLNTNAVTDLQIGLNYHIRHVSIGLGYHGYRAGSVAIQGISCSFGGYF